MVAHKKASKTTAMPKNSEGIVKYGKPHMVIPIEDMQWLLQQQSFPVHKLFEECWIADPFGSRFMQLNTCLAYSSFNMAKKVLSDTGLFAFERKTSIRDGRETICWMVKNLHGSRCKEYWLDTTVEELVTTPVELDTTVEELVTTPVVSISPQTQSEQEFQEASVTSQEHLINSSKEVMRCDSSSPPLTPPASRGVVEEAQVIEEEEIQIPGEAIVRVKEEMLLHELEALITPLELEDAFFDMVELKQEPSWSIKQALLDGKDKYRITLRNFAHRYGWKLPAPALLPTNIDRSFMNKRNGWNKKSYDEKLIRKELLYLFEPPLS